MSKPVTWTAKEITQLLRSKYCGDQWAFISEVPNGTGLEMKRRCDVLAMCLWPSKGLHLHGHEIKVSRGDWLTEIQDVSKAAAFSRYCHYWWIVAPKGVVKLEELPSDWGLICPINSGLRAQKPATLNSPELPTHSLLAGIFRACCKASAAEAEIRAARDQGYSTGFTQARKGYEGSKQTDDNRRYESLKRSVDDFEKSSGIQITTYGGKRLGELVKAVERAGPIEIQRWIENIESSLKRFSGHLASASETVQQLMRGRADESISEEEVVE